MKKPAADPEPVARRPARARSRNRVCADDLPPPRAVTQDAPDDLPPPRTTTRKPRTPAAHRGGRRRTAAQRRTRQTTCRRPSRSKKAEGTRLSALAQGRRRRPAAGGRRLPDAPEADTYSTLRTSAYVLWQPSLNWEFRAGARLDGVTQDGGLASHRELLADYGDTYVRYRNGDTRLTLGAQTIIWGRVDEIPLADRVSRVDLTRFALDDLADRRRAQLAARWEQNFGGDYKLDAVWLPVFRGAQLPDVASIWSPINRTTDQIIGIDPALTPWVSAAHIDEDEHGSGGGALRLTKTGDPFDFGVTLARTRQSLPYYRLDLPALRLTAVHPFNTFVGADMEMVRGGLTWRMEAGYTDNVPVTLPTTAIDHHAFARLGRRPRVLPRRRGHPRQPATGRTRAANRPQHPRS